MGKSVIGRGFMSVHEVDEYLAYLEEPKRSTLEQVRTSILTVIPEAEQGMFYGAPVFRVAGKPVAGFSAAKDWLTYLPHSGRVLANMTTRDLEGFRPLKGALRFPVDLPLPDELIRKLIEARRREARI